VIELDVFLIEARIFAKKFPKEIGKNSGKTAALIII
jgi:hypothetical protein